MTDTTTPTATAHTVTRAHVLIGCAASTDDLTDAIRAAARGTVTGRRTVRLLDAATLDDLARPNAIAQGLGWQPTFTLPGLPGRVDMHLGVSL